MEINLVKPILVMCQVIIFVSIIVPVVLKDWISQGEILALEGSLTKITKGPELWEWEGEDYKDLADKYCDIFNDEDYYDNAYSPYEGLCITFTNLNTAGIVFIVCSSVCLFLWLIWTLLLIALILKKENKFIVTFSGILPIAVAILYIIGYTVWMRKSLSNFRGECDGYDDISIDDLDNQTEVCAETGAKFGLFTVLLNALYAPVFILVIDKKWYIEKKTEENSPESNVQIEMNNRESSPQSLPTLNIEPPTGIKLPQYNPSALNSESVRCNEGKYQNIPIKIPEEENEVLSQQD